MVAVVIRVIRRRLLCRPRPVLVEPAQHRLNLADEAGLPSRSLHMSSMAYKRVAAMRWNSHLLLGGGPRTRWASAMHERVRVVYLD
jgi:hypothetical protein